MQINDIKPKICYNTNSDIILISLHTPNIYNYASHSVKNLLAYVKKCNYGLIIYDKIFNSNVYPCWNKIPAILKNLSKCKYLVWIDADAIICNFSIPIEKFIKKDPNYDLYICTDIYIQTECVNSGVMIIKNSPWSFNLFEKVWESKIEHLHNDQNVIWLEITKEIHPYLPIKLKCPKYCLNLTHPKVKVLPENDFNSNIFNYKPNDFILHLMGAKTCSRINIMRQINTKLGLDDYSEKDCVNILKQNKNKNRRRLINKICLNN